MNAPLRTLLTAAATLGLVATGAALRTGTQSAHADVNVTTTVPGMPVNGSIADVAERVVDSVVNVSVTMQPQPLAVDDDDDDQMAEPFGAPQQQGPTGGEASGVIVTAGGRILTNAHVVERATAITVTLPDGSEMPAKVVGSDSHADIAVIQLEGHVPPLKPITFGDSSAMRLGDVVLAVGDALGLGQSVSMGIISAKGRSFGGKIEEYEDFIQTDAAINHGNSGGALVNMKGELIGIPTAILSGYKQAQGLSFAIPTNMARPIMDMLVKDGRVSRGYLGVQLGELTAEVASQLRLPTARGVLIADLQTGGPASKAGFQPNDVIVGLAGNEVHQVSVLRNRIAMMKAGSKVDVDIVRQGQGKLTLHPVLGELPERPQLTRAQQQQQQQQQQRQEQMRQLQRRMQQLQGSP